MGFLELKRKVRANFDKMAEEGRMLFYVQINRDIIWDKYLFGFVEEEERQGHNCNSCKSFLRQYAGIVAIINNKIVSIWDDLGNIPDEFIEPMDNVRDYIHSLPITDVFLNEFAKCGTDKNTDKELNTIWNHFYIHIPNRMVIKKDIDKKRGDLRTTQEVFNRALNEISTDATDTILELIASNSIYRGQEFKALIQNFRAEQDAYSKLDGMQKQLYAWSRLFIINTGVARIRGSVIGTLLVDLSEGLNLDAAVGKYETKVAPQNYKRTTALVTPRMIKEAKQKLTDMGLLDSLGRRHAEPQDIKASNTLFVDRSAGAFDAFDDMTKEAQQGNVKSLGKVDEITIEKFISEVLPTARKVELLLENAHLPKFVTLITAENMDAPTLFKWNNPFSWSYTGGITDSMKERVKAAGGQITGELRCSLSWSNFDDLDIWLRCPNGRVIKYSNPRDCGGHLDVDMNAGGRSSRTPVENIVFASKDNIFEGNYELMVNQFSRREHKDVGYQVQIECQGQLVDLSFAKSPQYTDSIVKFSYTRAGGIVFKTKVETKLATKEKWGLKTNSFIKVKQLFLSPNHWSSNPIGNKHFMFMLEDCITDEEPKPFFNEFLNNTFVENRKVFEVMSNKFKVVPELNQVSGIGFSETLPGEVTLRVTGTVKRTLKIKF